MPSDTPNAGAQRVEVDGKMVFTCPNPDCDDEPDPRAVYAGVEASCDNENCRVTVYEWYDG